MNDLHVWDTLDKVKRWWQNQPLPRRMFWLMLVFYLATRLIGLTQFPIYFFGDEAAQANRAFDLVRDDGVGYDGVFLPTFFQNNNSYIHGTSVYVQVVAYLLFGRSVWAVRFLPALLSVLPALWVCLTLKNVYEVKHWWAGGFLLSVVPAWFLHSRTAFMTSLLVVFYAGFLYHYLMYRKGHTKHLLWALFWGAVAFYSYSAGQLIVVVSGVLLFLFDFKYHWQNRKLWPWALLVLAVCAIPFVRFMIVHPEEFTTRLDNYGSYWASNDLTLWQKLWQYIKEYWRARGVIYWFFPHHQDMARHTMFGYGHIYWVTLPLMALGIWRLWVDHRRDGLLWAILAAALAAPSGAAMIEIGITRVLVTVVPVVITAGVGLQWLIDWLDTEVLKQWKLDMLARFIFLGFVAFNCYMLWDALTNGPTWSTDYGMHGMQWGAQEVFDQVRQYREEDPERLIDLSPNWANNYNELERFFLGDEDTNFTTRNSLYGYKTEERPLTPDTLILMTSEEYANLMEDPSLFTDIKVVSTIMAPDMSIAFYWISMRYSEEAEAIFQAIEDERSRPVPDVLLLEGLEVEATHSFLDTGAFWNLTDGDLDSLIRTGGANPLVITLDFDEPFSMESIAFWIGSGASQLQLTVVNSDGESDFFDLFYEHVYDLRWAQVDFGSQKQVESLEVKLWNADEGEPSHVHVWEMVVNTPWEELP